MIKVHSRYETKTILDRDGYNLTGDVEICNEFNNLFTSIVTRLSSKIEYKGDPIFYLAKL